MSHPDPTKTYEDDMPFDREYAPLDSELAETPKPDDYKDAMKAMNLWDVERSIKDLPQQELKQLIENLVDDYGRRFGRLYH